MSTSASARLLAGVAALLTALAVGHAAPDASAAARGESCAEAVIDDWYGNSKVDKRYPLHCYRDAVASLTPEQKDYLHAEEDILRALAYARAGKSDPGSGSSSRKPSAGPGSPGAPSPGPTASAPEDGVSTEAVAAGDVASEEAAAVPLPLILLGGLALVLLAAGGAGAVSRRFGGSSGPDEN